MRYDRCLDEVRKQTGTYPYENNNPLRGCSYYMGVILEQYPVEWVERAIKDCEIIQEKVIRFKGEMLNENRIR